VHDDQLLILRGFEDLRISAVRISFDNYAHEDWSLIDAVQLVGRP
jgi:hypothetical protein